MEKLSQDLRRVPFEFGARECSRGPMIDGRFWGNSVPVRHLLTIITSKSQGQLWFEVTRRRFMPQHQIHALTMRDIEPLSPLVDLQRHGIADQLARQQEEYEVYLVERTANETPSYLVKLRAAQQAARSAVSSTKDDLRPQYSYLPIMWVAVAVAVSLLLFLKLRYS
jgi:hypothetical protein